jgi:hypothetical protein
MTVLLRGGCGRAPTQFRSAPKSDVKALTERSRKGRGSRLVNGRGCRRVDQGDGSKLNRLRAVRESGRKPEVRAVHYIRHLFHGVWTASNSSRWPWRSDHNSIRIERTVEIALDGAAQT